MNTFKIAAPPPFHEIDIRMNFHSWTQHKNGFPFMKLINECICIPQSISWIHSKLRCRPIHEIDTRMYCHSWNWSVNAFSFLNQFHEYTQNCGATALFMKSTQECIAIHEEIGQWMHLHSSDHFMNTLKIAVPPPFHKIDIRMYCHSLNRHKNGLPFMKLINECICIPQIISWIHFMKLT